MFLSSKNIDITRLSKKLDNKRFNSFEIKKSVDASYRLALLDIIRIYNIFYLKLLILIVQNSLLE